MSTHPDPEQLSAYIDGELTGTERDDVEQHLTSCSDCSATVRALRATVADMRALPAPLPSEQQSWVLRAAITKARKRPAERYRRWTIAAASVAAVAIAFAAFTTIGHTKRSTTGATGGGATAAPLQRTADAAALITVDPTNFDQNSALSLLGPTVTAGGLAPQAAATTRATTGTVGAAPPASASSPYGFVQNDLQAHRAGYLSAILRCEQAVLPADSSKLTASQYIVGTFEGTPAFFLIYSVAAGKETKLELWVVQRSDCYIRLFVPPR